MAVGVEVQRGCRPRPAGELRHIETGHQPAVFEAFHSRVAEQGCAALCCEHRVRASCEHRTLPWRERRCEARVIRRPTSLARKPSQTYVDRVESQMAFANSLSATALEKWPFAV